MDNNETGCQAPPDAPTLCVNNCGFFGTTATRNMCSKCHKDLMLKEEAKLAASSISSIVNGRPHDNGKESSVSPPVVVSACQPEPLVVCALASCPSVASSESSEKPEGPARCGACRKRVGLAGFGCRCGNIFCSVHRFSDKHECTYEYREVGRAEIAKANPVVKAKKLDKI